MVGGSGGICPLGVGDHGGHRLLHGRHQPGQQRIYLIQSQPNNVWNFFIFGIFFKFNGHYVIRGCRAGDPYCFWGHSGTARRASRFGFTIRARRLRQGATPNVAAAEWWEEVGEYVLLALVTMVGFKLIFGIFFKFNGHYFIRGYSAGNPHCFRGHSAIPRRANDSCLHHSGGRLIGIDLRQSCRRFEHSWQATFSILDRNVKSSW